MSDNKADDLTDDQVKIDIWGICVNRDIFRVQDEFRGSEGRIKVNKYYKACSFVSQFTKRNGPELTLEDLQVGGVAVLYGNCPQICSGRLQ